jgi:hypothetical protein
LFDALESGDGVRAAKIADLSVSGRELRELASDDLTGIVRIGRPVRHASYGMSQKRRKMIECIFGWGKQHGTMRKAKHRGVARIAGLLVSPEDSC